MAAVRAAFVLAAAGLLVVAAPAGAAPTWLSPTKLSAPGQNAERPQVAVDAQGDALAVWQRLNEKSATTTIEASSRPGGSGAWTAPVTVSNSSEEASEPQVALDSKGDAVVVWISHGAEYSVQAATRSGLTGSWQAPTTLQNLGTMTVAEPRPDLAVNQRGDAIAIWQRYGAGKEAVEAAGRPAGSVWQAPETLSTEAVALHPAEVGIDTAGAATAVWEEHVGIYGLIVASNKPASGKWQHPVALSAEGDNANEPRVAVDAKGDAVAAWERPESGEEIIEATDWQASTSAWRPSVKLTKPAEIKEPANQEVAIDGKGDAVVTWSWLKESTHDIVEAAESQVSSSAWQAPVVLSPPGGLTEEKPQVAVNEQGNAVVVWERFNGANEIVEAAPGLAATGSWQAPVPLSAPGQNASEQQVALDAQGNAAAVWSRSDGKAFIAEASGYDAAGPLLSSVVIPTMGTVGQTLSFSASPFDVWSALGATSWSFGDGTSQAGTSVTHAYTAPGTFTVTVTALDAVGNATSASAAVAITAPETHPLVLAPAPPKITGARLSHSRFRVSKHPTAISAATSVPQGTSFQFTLNEAAKLQIVFQHATGGLRSGARCVAPTAKLRRKHARRCTRTLTVGTLIRAHEGAGPDSLAFSGRIGSKALSPGAYRALFSASAGGLTSTPVALSLTIVH